MTLFAATTTHWLSNWLTPFWLIGLGALLGLAALFVLWFLALIVSRIRGAGSSSNELKKGLQAGVVLSLVIFVALGAVILSPSLIGGEPIDTVISSNNVPMVACLLAILSWLLGFSLIKLTSRRAVDEVADAVREGPLWPIFVTTVIVAIFGIVGYFVATTPKQILTSLTRLPASGSETRTAVIPPEPQANLNKADPPQHPIAVSFRRSELQSLVFKSDQTVTIDFRDTGDVDLNPPFRVNAGEPVEWRKTSQTTLTAEGDEVTELFVRNYGPVEAHLDVTYVTAPEHPQVSTIVLTAISVVAIFLLYLLQRTAMPRLSAVALSTFKSEIAQPLFLIVMAVGLFAVVAFIWVPYNTLGEDIKVLKDTGMTLIMILAIIQAIWAASTSVADEIEGRTALTVLSKPIGRGSFICGKYLGIFWTVAVIFVVIGTVFMLSVAYKPIYDNREGSYKPIYEEQTTSNEDITWQQCHYEMVGIVPGLVLAFLETIVLAALSVAISTRLPMLANFIICFSIYVLGHLTPLIVQSSVGKFAPVRFVAELLSTVLPILDHFNIQAAVSTGATVPYDYLGWTLLYSFLYGVMALLLALLLFEDRDLA